MRTHVLRDVRRGVDTRRRVSSAPLVSDLYPRRLPPVSASRFEPGKPSTFFWTLPVSRVVDGAIPPDRPTENPRSGEGAELTLDRSNRQTTRSSTNSGIVRSFVRAAASISSMNRAAWWFRSSSTGPAPSQASDSA